MVVLQLRQSVDVLADRQVRHDEWQLTHYYAVLSPNWLLKQKVQALEV